MKPIKIIGAKQNNLKDISLEIPKHKLTVFTGRSGSWQSSLVFNTIAVESERLLKETYSTYIQNQLNHYDKPVVDRIENLHVSMVIGQDRIGGNSRSTVGKISDIYYGVRLLWSRVGQPFVGYYIDLSFNNTNGMCKTCDGLGYVEDIDLNELLHFDRSLNEDAIKFPSFAPDTWHGKRYRPEVLEAKIKGYFIADMLQLSVEKAIDFFPIESVNEVLKSVKRTGLDYIQKTAISLIVLLP